MNNADDLPTIYMSEANLAKLLSDKPASLILGGWAKADSLYVISDDEDNLLDKIDYPNYVQSRQFSFIVWIMYDDDSYDFYQKSFDWMNTDWQYNAMVITPNYAKNIVSIKCLPNYSCNHGTMYFTDPTLCECSFEKKTYIDDKVDTIESSHSKWITKYFYDDEDRVTEVSYIDSTNTNNTYTNKMYYNKNGVVYKQIDYKGIVTEKVFNDNGMEVQTKTYHTSRPAEVFYTESKLGENGETLTDYNELGEEINAYEYVGKTSKVSTVTDKQGNKTAYGYDTYNDTLLQMTTDVDGVSNTNTYTYSDGYLTKVSHNDLDITYDYDHQGRLCKVCIGDKEYVSFGYEDNSLVSSSFQSIQTTTYNSGECFKQVTDKDGNVIEIYYIPSDGSEEVLLLENIYDSLGNLLQTIEHTDGATLSTYYYRDKFGNINLLNTTQHGVDVVKESIFDDEGNQTELTYSIEDLDIVQAYEYTYTSEPESTLSSISLPIEDMYQSITTDHLGRSQKVQLINNSVINPPITFPTVTTYDTQPLHYLFSTSYDYLKRGDHTSNLVSNVRYGLDDKCTDYLSYKYDHRGNISEVYENNLLVCRYTYDALSRLIREDNKLFGKTYTWSYDAGGNILNRFEYDFTLRDELRDKTPTVIPYTYATSYTDQLMSYNGQTFTYDILGNPTTYKGVNLTWSRGRQLVSYGDIATYTYNVSGIRTSKQVGNTTTNYFLDGTRILAQVDTVTGVDDTMVTTTTEYIYGADGITGFVVDGTPYYYKKNLQGDIIAILDSNLQIVTKYAYDAWGNFRIYCYNGTKFIDMTDETSYTDTDATEIALSNRYIAIKNPFRYRSYYFDIETGLYYLNSRYYDPETGRFITIDDISVISDYMNTFNGLNLYAYCINNPIMHIDESGRGILDWLLGIVSVLAVAVGTFMLITGVGGGFGGLLISVGVNSLINGLTNQGAGGSFAAGWLGGVITGVIAGIGVGIVGSALLKSISFVGVKSLGNMSKAILVSLGSGFTASILGETTTKALDNQLINSRNLIMNALTFGAFNIIGGYGNAVMKHISKSLSGTSYNLINSVISNLTEYVSNISYIVHALIFKR